MRKLLGPVEGPSFGHPVCAAFAAKLIAASLTVRRMLPDGFKLIGALEILAVIYVSEDAGDYLTLDAVSLRLDANLAVTERWLNAMVAERLVEIDHGLIALTSYGHHHFTDLIRQLSSDLRGSEPPLV